MNRVFEDRQEAGEALAKVLFDLLDRDGSIAVLALPRGGVPVAAEIARRLQAPLDVFIVRKLGAPGQEELAMGAIASGGVRVMNQDVVRALGVTEREIDAVAGREQREIERRETRYRGGRAPLDVAGKTIILVDDGVATGATMRAAVAALRKQNPAQIVVAVPHAAEDSYQQLRREADDVICLETPEPYVAVGCWYRRFPQTTDEEVQRLLGEASVGTEHSH
jgi:predicted phosphoribosyltransferase